MPAKKTAVAPLPQHWLDAVIPILERGDPSSILWTGRAQREMSAAGIQFNWMPMNSASKSSAHRECWASQSPA